VRLSRCWPAAAKICLIFGMTDAENARIDLIPMS
jgi:hypothetical protein